MNLQEFGAVNAYSKGVREYLISVEELSSKPFQIRIEKGLQSPATVRMARETMPYHEIKLNPKFEQQLEYLLVNKAFNVERLFRVEPAERKIPATTERNISVAIAKIASRTGNAKMRQLERNLQGLIQGIISQVNNIPVQIAIEQDILDRLPILHTKQRMYLEHDVKNCLAALSPVIKASVPSVIFDASNAINYAWTTSLPFGFEELAEAAFRNEVALKRQGLELKNKYEAVAPRNHLEDIEVVNLWTTYLRLEGWFSWVDYEAIPESYRNYS